MTIPHSKDLRMRRFARECKRGDTGRMVIRGSIEMSHMGPIIRGRGMAIIVMTGVDRDLVSRPGISRTGGRGDSRVKATRRLREVEGNEIHSVSGQ